MSNKTLMQKADLALADLQANGGLLNPEQANTFIRNLLAAPTMINVCRVVTMGAPTRKINKIGFDSRILRKGVQGQALVVDSDDPNYNEAAGRGTRSKPTTSQIELVSKEVIAEIRLPYDVIEDNIERGNINFAGANASHRPLSGGLKDTIVAMIAERAAYDLEELALLGDKASGDAYLAMVDGFLKLSNQNVVNGSGATISKEVFKNAMKMMPDAYLRNRAQMKHFVSVDNEIEYRDSLADRETGLGDSNIQAYRPVYAFGTPVMPVSQMPEVNGLFCNPLNLIMGIQRDISIEVDKDITTREFIIVLTARVDFQIEESKAVVKVENLG